MYYKKLDISITSIVRESKAFLKTEPRIMNRTDDVTFNFTDNNTVFDKIPSIRRTFSKMGLTCTKASFFVMYMQEHCTIHSDVVNYPYRINIPILNCKDSSTVFYRGGLVETTYNVNGRPRHTVINEEDCVEVDRVKLDAATILDVSELHKVILTPKTKVPRISLTLSFAEELGLELLA